MNYTVLIEETVSQEFTVSAASEAEARRLAEEKYRNGEFVLEPGNLEHVSIQTISKE